MSLVSVKVQLRVDSLLVLQNKKVIINIRPYTIMGGGEEVKVLKALMKGQKKSHRKSEKLSTCSHQSGLTNGS